MAAKKPEEAKDAGKGGMSTKQTLIAFVVAGAIAGGVGAGAGMMTGPEPPPVKDAGKPAERKKEEEAKLPPVVQMGSMDIPPVVTNLASPKETWVRIEGAVLFEGKTLPHGDILAAQISADLLAYMRTQSLDQIQGVTGLEHLRADINDRVATRSEGHVKEFIIKALVVQ